MNKHLALQITRGNYVYYLRLCELAGYPVQRRFIEIENDYMVVEQLGEGKIDIHFEPYRSFMDTYEFVETENANEFREVKLKEEPAKQPRYPAEVQRVLNHIQIHAGRIARHNSGEKVRSDGDLIKENRILEKWLGQWEELKEKHDLPDLTLDLDVRKRKIDAEG